MAPDTWRSRSGRSRLRGWPGEMGLHVRATVTFGLVAAAVAVLTGLSAWFSVAGYLLSQRHEAATTQAAVNVEQIARGLQPPGITAPEALAGLPHQLASTSLLYTAEDEWFTDDLTINRGTVPGALAALVMEGRPHSQRVEVGGDPALVVGLPVEGVGAAYFEVFMLTELDDTLTTLTLVMVVGGLVIPVATMAVGRWAVRPALRPLEQVAGAVAAVAAGDLGTRLDARGDRSLQLIADSFNSTVDALERRVKQDAKFAADVSHELRSPLTTMVTSVHLMASHRDSLDPDGQEALDLLHTEVDGFRRLVQDLLDISRADAGSDRLAMAEVRLAELVERALPPHLLSCLTVTPAAESAEVRADKRRLRQALMNLVANAELHGAGLTGVHVDAAEREVCLAVEDAGPGLRADELERIFDRFARGRGSERGSTDGAGLGLALVAQHVRLMGGTVSAENRTGRGARFVVRLPRAGTGTT